MEGEQQLWKKQKADLENLMVELEQKIQVLQSKNDALQDTLEALQNSYRNLEKELELTNLEKTSFVEKVSGFMSLHLNLLSGGGATTVLVLFLSGQRLLYRIKLCKGFKFGGLELWGILTWLQ